MDSKSRNSDIAADGGPDVDETLRELERIENLFVAALARGEVPSVAKVVAAHPRLAERLRTRLDYALAMHVRHHPLTPPIKAEAGNCAPRTARLPERIDRYVVDGKLGEGAASIVLRAFDPVLDRHVAIKLLRLELPAGSDFTARFAREARLVARLRHAHIVPVYDCGEFAGRPYLVMELVKGKTLDGELADHELRGSGFEKPPPLNPPANRGKEAPSPFAGRAGVGGVEPDRSRVGEDITSPAELAAVDAGLCPTSEAGGGHRPENHRNKLGGDLGLDRHGRHGTGRVPSDGMPFDYRRTADLVRKIAEALHFAHERGIVHRDVKPGNILLDERGEPQLADFGLAMRGVEAVCRTDSLSVGVVMRSTDCQSVRIEAQSSNGQAVGENEQSIAGDVRTDSPHYACGEPSLTLTQQFLGTPAYMSPEQAAGRAGDADARSDVFSLGIVLYRLLTGRRPFVGTDAELREQIIHVTPTRPSRINRRVPRDLETICLKAMEKSQADRYQTAHQMADELRRWLDDLPLAITPPRRPRRIARWCARNRLTACLILVTTVFVFASVIAGHYARLRHHDAVTAAAAREESVVQQLLTQGRDRLRIPAEGRNRTVRSELLPQIAAHLLQLRSDAPLDDFQLQARSLLAGSFGEIDLEVLGEVPLPVTTPNLHWPVALHPSGNFVALGATDRPHRIGCRSPVPPSVPVENKKPTPKMVFSVDGRWLAFARGAGGLEIWDESITERRASLPDLNVLAMAFAADGGVLHVCGSDGRYHRLQVPQLDFAPDAGTTRFGTSEETSVAAFSSDLTRIAVGDRKGRVVIEWIGGGVQNSIQVGTQPVDVLTWSPDSALIAVGTQSGIVELFDLHQQSVAGHFQVGNVGVAGVSFSSCGRWLATAAYGTGGRLWDLRTGELALEAVYPLRGFAGDNRRLVGTGQGLITMYELVMPTVLRRLPGHRASVERFAWSRDGRVLASLDSRFRIRVRDAIDQGHEVELTLESPEWYAADAGLALDDRGQWLAAVYRTKLSSEFRLIDLSDRKVETFVLPAGYDRVACIGEGRFLSVREEACEFNRDACRTVVREFARGRGPVERGVLRESKPDEQGFFCQGLTADGRYYQWTGPRVPRSKTRTEVWDVAARRLVLAVPQPGADPAREAIAFMDPAGKSVWVSNLGLTARYSIASPGAHHPVPGIRYPMAVSIDGKWSVEQSIVGTVVNRSSINLVTLENERPWSTFSNRDGSGTATHALAFSPDGRSLAWGSQSGEITLVDLPLLKQKVDEFERKYDGNAEAKR